MSPQNSGKKQSVGIYTVMLIFAFIFMTIGAILLYMELNRFGTWPQWKVSQAVSDSTHLVVAEAEPTSQVKLLS